MVCTLSTTLRYFFSLCHVIFSISFLPYSHLWSEHEYWHWAFYSEISNISRVKFDFTLSVMVINRIISCKVRILSWDFIKRMVFLLCQMIPLPYFLTLLTLWIYRISKSLPSWECSIITVFTATASIFKTYFLRTILSKREYAMICVPTKHISLLLRSFRFRMKAENKALLGTV